MSRTYFRAAPVPSLHLFLTTLCSMRCPDCCMNIPRLRGRHLDVAEVEEAGRLLHGIEHLYVTGGEPTMHPRFAEIAPRLRGMFGCRTMSLCTNGFRVREYQDLLPLFDDVLISHYEENVAEADFVREVHVDNRAPGLTRHLPHQRRAASPAPCFRALEGIAFAHGRLHPCCVALGPEGGIPLAGDWREAVRNTPLPCPACCFAEERDSPAGQNVLHALEPGAHLHVEGVHPDGWMGRRLEVHIPEAALHRMGGQGGALVIGVRALGPASLHPLRLEARGIGGEALGRLEASASGEYAWRVPLSRVSAQGGEARVTVAASGVFNPARLHGEEHNDRDLSVLIARLVLDPGEA